jgi:hypothetical protein
MTRSTLRPLRTRRAAISQSSTRLTPVQLAQLNPKTRQTLGALGGVWLAFAATSGLAASVSQHEAQAASCARLS